MKDKIDKLDNALEMQQSQKFERRQQESPPRYKKPVSESNYYEDEPINKSKTVKFIPTAPEFEEEEEENINPIETYRKLTKVQEEYSRSKSVTDKRGQNTSGILFPSQNPD